LSLYQTIEEQKVTFLSALGVAKQGREVFVYALSRSENAFSIFFKINFVGRYKAQHPETAESMQADERAHELEEAVNRAPSASKRRASATASVTAASGSGQTLCAGEALERVGSSEHGDVSLDRFAHRSRERSRCFYAYHHSWYWYIIFLVIFCSFLIFF
jgi:hypothetical protein